MVDVDKEKVSVPIKTKKESLGFRSPGTVWCVVMMRHTSIENLIIGVNNYLKCLIEVLDNTFRF